MQTHLIDMVVEYGSGNITLQDICKKPMAPQNNNCTVLSALQYWQNDAKKLDKCIDINKKPCKSIGQFTMTAGWGDHLQKCAK